MTMFVAIFNLGVNKEGADKAIKTICDCANETFEEWMDSKFLGVLLHIRHYVLCDKYFLRRKRDFAASFTIFLNMVKPSLVHRVSQTLIFKQLIVVLVCC